MNAATLRYSKAEIEQHVFLFSCLAPFSKPAADSLVTFDKHKVSRAFSLHLRVLVVLDQGKGVCETASRRALGSAPLHININKYSAKSFENNKLIKLPLPMARHKLILRDPKPRRVWAYLWHAWLWACHTKVEFKGFTSVSACFWVLLCLNVCTLSSTVPGHVFIQSAEVDSFLMFVFGLSDNLYIATVGETNAQERMELGNCASQIQTWITWTNFRVTPCTTLNVWRWRLWCMSS